MVVPTPAPENASSLLSVFGMPNTVSQQATAGVPSSPFKGPQSSSMGGILSQEKFEAAVPVTSRRGYQQNQSTMGSIINQDDEVPKTLSSSPSKKLVPNATAVESMATVLSHATEPATTFRRVRQAPGGTSSIVIG